MSWPWDCPTKFSLLGALFQGPSPITGATNVRQGTPHEGLGTPETSLAVVIIQRKDMVAKEQCRIGVAGFQSTRRKIASPQHREVVVRCQRSGMATRSASNEVERRLVFYSSSFPGTRTEQRITLLMELACLLDAPGSATLCGLIRQVRQMLKGLLRMVRRQVRQMLRACCEWSVDKSEEMPSLVMAGLLE